MLLAQLYRARGRSDENKQEGDHRPLPFNVVREGAKAREQEQKEKRKQHDSRSGWIAIKINERYVQAEPTLMVKKMRKTDGERCIDFFSTFHFSVFHMRSRCASA